MLEYSITHAVPSPVFLHNSMIGLEVDKLECLVWE